MALKLTIRDKCAIHRRMDGTDDIYLIATQLIPDTRSKILEVCYACKTKLERAVRLRRGIADRPAPIDLAVSVILGESPPQ